jgi:hypothetical protein
MAKVVPNKGTEMTDEYNAGSTSKGNLQFEVQLFSCVRNTKLVTDAMRVSKNNDPACPLDKKHVLGSCGSRDLVKVPSEFSDSGGRSDYVVRKDAANVGSHG